MYSCSMGWPVLGERPRLVWFRIGQLSGLELDILEGLRGPAGHWELGHEKSHSLESKR